MEGLCILMMKSYPIHATHSLFDSRTRHQNQHLEKGMFAMFARLQSRVQRRLGAPNAVGAIFATEARPRNDHAFESPGFFSLIWSLRRELQNVNKEFLRESQNCSFSRFEIENEKDG